MKYRGFTLIELLVVIAILIALVTITIPLFQQHQLKAKRTEGPLNLKIIAMGEEAYKITNDTYLSITATPAGNPTNLKRAWTNQALWDPINFQPTGDVYFRYGVRATGATAFYAEAAYDLDGDGLISCYTATESLSVHARIATDPAPLVEGQCSDTNE